MASFNPTKDIGDLSGKVFLITGGTAGLGAGSIRYLAAHNPSHIYFTGRNAHKAEEVISSAQKEHADAPITFLEMDSTNLTSVHACAKKFLSLSDRLDVLTCNAGIAAVAPGLSRDGYEIQFQVNHLAHALLVKLLLPLMEKTAETPGADVRIVNLSSVAYEHSPGIEFDTLKTDQSKLGGIFGSPKWMRYAQSKLANVLYAVELAKRYPKILTVAVHPGYIYTDMLGDMPFLTKLPVLLTSYGRWISVEEGPYQQLWAATADRNTIQNGAFYNPVGKFSEKSTKSSKDEGLAKKLWEWSQDQLKEFE